MAVQLASFSFSPYHLCVFLSALLCVVLYALRLEKHHGRGTGCALLLLPMGIVLGTVCAKLFYILVQLPKVINRGFSRQLFSTEPSLFAFTGGLLGVVLAVWLCAKLCKISTRDALNLFAPIGALLAALCRFSEGFLVEAEIGLGEQILNSSLHFFPLSVRIPDWDEYYGAVFMLEGVCCLVVVVLSWKCFRNHCFLRTLFALCLPQIFCQSLLKDNLMWWFFLKVEQLFCAVVCLGIILYHFFKYRKGALSIALGGVGIVIIAFCEYALDKITEIPSVITYVIMGAALVLMALAEMFAYEDSPDSLKTAASEKRG